MKLSDVIKFFDNMEVFTCGCPSHVGLRREIKAFLQQLLDNREKELQEDQHNKLLIHDQRNLLELAKSQVVQLQRELNEAQRIVFVPTTPSRLEAQTSLEQCLRGCPPPQFRSHEEVRLAREVAQLQDDKRHLVNRVAELQGYLDEGKITKEKLESELAAVGRRNRRLLDVFARVGRIVTREGASDAGSN